MPYYYKDRELFPAVEIYHDVVPYLGGITMREFFLDGEKCANAWRIANAKVSAYFGDLLKPRQPSAAPLSYGHLVCLGAPLTIPEDGEPNIAPPAHSIDEAIELLKAAKDVDFTKHPIYQQYYDMWQYLKKEFPGQNVPFSGMGVEGPVTSAELFRGQDFFIDVMEEPEKTLEYLDLMTESCIRFTHTIRKTNGDPPVRAQGTGLADDFASMIPTGMWEEFVIPFWNRYYEGLTTGHRFLHCENMCPEQIPYIKLAKVDHYQPSVADRLTLENVKANTDLPFDWLLYAYHVTSMSDEEIQVWVDKTVEAGVSKIRTQFGMYAWQERKLDRILAFYKAFDKYKV